MPDDIKSGEEGNHAAGGSEDGKTVPLTALTGARDELKGQKEENQQLKGQIELYKANAATTPVQEVVDDLDGLKEDDVVTVADVKKLMGTQKAEFLAVANQLKAGQGTPDYEKTIEKYLPGVLADNAELAAAIKTSNNPVALALTLAKSSDQYRKDQQTKDVNAETNVSTVLSAGDQILENQQKPGATSTGAGAGGGVSNLDAMLAMTPEQLENKIAKITSGS